MPRLHIQSSVGPWLVGFILITLVTGIVLARALPGLPRTVEVIPKEPPPPVEPEAPADDEIEEPAATPSNTESGANEALEEEPSAEAVILFPELRDDELRSKLKQFSEAGHDELSYRRAREVMYWHADNVDGVVTTIYARRPTPLPAGTWPDQQVLNCEHLWPQSKGAKKPPMRTDLFHLRPAVPRINSTRSNYPFGIPAASSRSTAGWRVGKNASGMMVFEPPPSVRGDVSRSLFYFAVRYKKSIDDRQESILRVWSAADPVDDVERARAGVIEEYQGNSNPFIIDETAVQRISDF